jgi:hypothetical protein
MIGAAFSSCSTSSATSLISNGVRELPPPRGNSTSVSALRFDMKEKIFTRNIFTRKFILFLMESNVVLLIYVELGLRKVGVVNNQCSRVPTD